MKPIPHRRLAPPALLAAALLLFSACGATAATAGDAISMPPDASSAGSTALVLPADGLGSLYPQGQLRSALSTLNFGDGAAARHGYYELRNQTVDEGGGEDGPCNILYTDYATRQQTVLCANPACAHSSADCTGWLPDTAYRYLLGEAAGGLVLVDRGTLDYQHDAEGHLISETATPGPVYTMDYSGANRKAVYTPAGNCSAEGQCLLTDDEALYLVYHTPPPDPAKEYADYDAVRQLVRVDLATGDGRPLYTMNPTLDNLEAAMEGQLLLRTTERPRDDRELGEDFAAWEANLRAGVQRLFTIDPATGEKTMLPAKLPDYGFGGWVLDGRTLYYNVDNPDYVPGTDTPDTNIYQVDLPTGLQDVFITMQPMNKAYVYSLIDGRIVYFNSEETGVAEDDLITWEESWHWADIASRQTNALTLSFTLSEVLEGYTHRSDEVVRPLADAGDSYLVRCGYTQLALDHYGDVRALISKEDYWAGRENYVPITMLG